MELSKNYSKYLWTFEWYSSSHGTEVASGTDGFLDWVGSFFTIVTSSTQTYKQNQTKLVDDKNHGCLSRQNQTKLVDDKNHGCLSRQNQMELLDNKNHRCLSDRSFWWNIKLTFSLSDNKPSVAVSPGVVQYDPAVHWVHSLTLRRPMAAP